MSKLVKYDHQSIQEVEKKADLRKIDPHDIDFSRFRRSAISIKKYLEDPEKDPYTICVKARGAMNNSSECIQVVSYMLGYYHVEAKKLRSIAKLEKADEWLKKNKPDVRITDGLRESYCDMDEEYITAKLREKAAAAMLEYLRNKHGDFEQDLNLAKKKMVVDGVDESKAGYDNIKDEDEYEG